MSEVRLVQLDGRRHPVDPDVPRYHARHTSCQCSMHDARDAAPVSPPRDAACTQVAHGKRRTSPGPAPRRREANPRPRPRLEIHLSRVVNIVNRPCQSSPARALGGQPQMRTQMQMHARRVDSREPRGTTKDDGWGMGDAGGGNDRTYAMLQQGLDLQVRSNKLRRVPPHRRKLLVSQPVSDSVDGELLTAMSSRTTFST